MELKIKREFKDNDESAVYYEADHELLLDDIISIFKSYENNETELLICMCDTFDEEGGPLSINIGSFDETYMFYNLPNPAMGFNAIYIDRKTKDYKYSVSMNTGSQIVVCAANKIVEEIVNENSELRRMQTEQEKKNSPFIII